MKTFTCPDGLTIVLDKVTHIEHLTQTGYKPESPWGFDVGLVSAEVIRFPSAKTQSMHGLPGGRQGWQSFDFKAVDRVRTELVAALEGAPQKSQGSVTGDNLDA